MPNRRRSLSVPSRSTAGATHVQSSRPSRPHHCNQPFRRERVVRAPQRLLDEGAKVTLASIDREEILGTVHDEPGKTSSRTSRWVKSKSEIMMRCCCRAGWQSGSIAHGRSGHRNHSRLRRNRKTGRCDLPWSVAARRGGRAAWADGHKLAVDSHDLRNAGANVVDRAAVVDGNLITSRNRRIFPPSTTHW